MKEFNKFITNLKEDVTGLSVAKIAKIVKFNSSNMTADVQPLPSNNNAIVLNVPVASIKSSKFNVYIPYEPGDYVLLVYIDNDIDNLLLGNDNVNSTRERDDSDCVIVGGITLLTEEVEQSDDLVITNKENTASITMSEDGDINIKGETVTITGRKESSTWL